MKLRFLSMPTIDGATVCESLNMLGLAEYLFGLWPDTVNGVTYAILRLPDDYPIETLESAKDGPG